jgi:hypothetical protein
MSAAQVLPSHVIKRDGGVKPFVVDKIADAIARAGIASGEFDGAEAQRLTRHGVLPRLAALGPVTPHIEQIQDQVEATLFDAGWRARCAPTPSTASSTASCATRARPWSTSSRRWRSTCSSATGASTPTPTRATPGRADPQRGGQGGGQLLAGPCLPAEVGRPTARPTSTSTTSTCSRLLRRLVAAHAAHEGLNGVPGKVEAGRPSTCPAPWADRQLPGHAAERMGRRAGVQLLRHLPGALCAQGRPGLRAGAPVHAGAGLQPQRALALGHPDAVHQPHLRLDCPEDLREQVPVIGGREMPFTYGELQAEMDLINRAYIEVMTAGDAKGRAFTFPIPTYNITKDFDWDSPNAERLFEMTARYGLPYFQNFLNSDLQPHMVRSMCCRLQLDLRELLKRGNGLFGSAEQTGSVGVVTLNCARLGYLYAGDEAGLLARLDELLELAAQPRDQAQGDPAPDRPGPVPLHQALPRHAAQPLLDHRRERHQRDDAQLQRRRRGHHHARGEALCRCACSTTCARAWSSSRRKRATSTTWRPRRPRARPTASPRKTASATPASCRPAATSSRTTPTPRSCRWASPTTRSRPWRARSRCSASTPAAPCCTCT